MDIKSSDVLSKLTVVCALCCASIAVPASAQVPDDARWDVRFGLPGTDNAAVAVVADGDEVFAGGNFTMAGNANASYVARWDGTNWSNLGSGITGAPNVSFVLVLARQNGNLFAGGAFTNAGGIAANGIARWDGTNWSALPGISGTVNELIPSGSDLYVGGTLSFTGDTNLYGFARWDGTNWFNYGSTISGCFGAACAPGVAGILPSGSDVFVGGIFTNFAGVAANYIVRWDGTNWSPLGSGLGGVSNLFVSAVALRNGELFVGGAFQSAGGVSATNLAKWNGATWSAVANANGSVRKLRMIGAGLYAAGEFTQIGGVNANRIAQWDGAVWSPLDTGLLGGKGQYVYSLVLGNSSDLYVAGFLTGAGPVAVANLARWDGTNWSSVGGSVGHGMNSGNGQVRGFDLTAAGLYAVGVFDSAGDVQANRIARWDGTNWVALGAGLSAISLLHQTRGVAHLGNDLYVGGSFTNAGSALATNVAKWDGTNWSAVSGGVNSNVLAAAASAAHVYFGGGFTLVGNTPASRVARWNGVWDTMDSGVNNTVNAVVVSVTNVYVGGTFTTAGSGALSANRIACWNGSAWSALGTGISGGSSPSVSAIAVSGSNVYVGGNFSSAGGAAVTNIARWDGTAWHSLGGGVWGSGATPVSAIAVHGNDVYVGGNITNAAGVAVRGLARWNGTNWSSVGSGLANTPTSPAVFALAIWNDDLFVGGNFNRAGGKPSVGIARWTLQPSVQLLSPRWEGSLFLFDVGGVVGLKFAVQATADFINWTTLATANGGLTPFTFADPSSDSNKFYRALLIP